MGFTRYWETKRDFTFEEFRALYKEFIEITVKLDAVKLEVAFEKGDRGAHFRAFMTLKTTPENPYDGPGEPFLFAQGKGQLQCRTNLAPYDVIVRSFLRKTRTMFPDVIRHCFDGKTGVEEDKEIDPPVEKLLVEITWYASSKHGCGDISYEMIDGFMKDQIKSKRPVRVMRGIHRYELHLLLESFIDFQRGFLMKTKDVQVISPNLVKK
jgi:hypothetical protein